ncbi:hypothetical protein AtNW77_Chr2g0255351 [Arabidopsis thaliana]
MAYVVFVGWSLLLIAPLDPFRNFALFVKFVLPCCFPFLWALLPRLSF